LTATGPTEKRTAALENRIPDMIWLMLTLMLTTIGVLTSLMFGYAPDIASGWFRSSRR